MPNKPIISIMGQDCPPGKEEEYNKWYTEHISAFFKHKALKSAVRFKRIGDDETLPQYIAIYSFDSQEEYEQYMKSPEREAGIKVAGRPDGVKMRLRGQFELIKEWKK